MQRWMELAFEKQHPEEETACCSNCCNDVLKGTVAVEACRVAGQRCAFQRGTEGIWQSALQYLEYRELGSGCTLVMADVVSLQV